MSDASDFFQEPEVKEGYGVSCTYYKWKPYKSASRTKKKGRWQVSNGYGGFENADKPLAVLKEFLKSEDIALRCNSFPALKAENEQLRKAVNLMNCSVVLAHALEEGEIGGLYEDRIREVLININKGCKIATCGLVDKP